MPSIYLPYVNIALDAFALLVTLIIFAVCISEYSNKKEDSIHFLLLQISVIIALISDMLGWLGEGHPSLSAMTLVSNTVASCACQIIILSFMSYLIASFYANNRAAKYVLNIFRVLCVFSIILCIGNAFLGYVYAVNEQGYWQRIGNAEMCFAYLLFPILSFFTIILLTFLAKKSKDQQSCILCLYAVSHCGNDR